MKALLPKHDQHSIGLIGHHIVNYPSPEAAHAAIDVMATEGVQLIELQIPFSEPIADGPVFLAANHTALAAGVDVPQSLALMQKVTELHPIPFVFMTYANIIVQKGMVNFINAAKLAGARGAIIPDLPFDSVPEYWDACHDLDFAAIPVIPPNMSAQRLHKILPKASGFVYAVARTGVTGAKTKFGPELLEFVQKIRDNTDLPVAVGFGVGSAADVEFLRPHADYAIVGTQAMLTLQEHGLIGLRKFWRELYQASQA